MLSESSNADVRVRSDLSARSFATPARERMQDGQPSFIALGLQTGTTGKGADTYIIDDPYANEADARSKVINEGVYRFWTDTLEPRIEDTTNIIVMFHRYHLNDFAGRLMKTGGFEEHRFPAICDDAGTDPMSRQLGDLLSPKHTRAYLEELRSANPYMFAGQFQGRPMPEGSAIFNAPTFYDSLPEDGYTVVVGLDLAYTAKTIADWSVIVVGRMVGDTLYVSEVIRRQVSINDLVPDLLRLRKQYPRATFTMATGGQESGIVDLLNDNHKLKIRSIPATADKVIRSQQSSSAWNLGKIRVPVRAVWLDAFLDIVLSFTGRNDAHDDDVDALANCYNEGIDRYNFLKNIA